MIALSLWLLVVAGGTALLLLSGGRRPYDGVAEALLAPEKVDAPPPSSPDTMVQGAASQRLRGWAFGGGLAAVLRMVVTGSFDTKAVLVAAGGAVVGDLYVRHRAAALKQREVQRLEFYLPTVMERIVMAVGSGFDIVPALAEAARGSADPVSKVLLRICRLAEGGLPVEAALRAVSQEVPSSAVKHALVHLGLAYRQGGEVVRPLKELSDATQSHYQDTVEEAIAKLPVKAVLPLVFTFAGLIVCFLTVPLVQVSSLTSKVLHDTK
jgi:pilus assembly protein TadC